MRTPRAAPSHIHPPRIGTVSVRDIANAVSKDERLTHLLFQVAAQLKPTGHPESKLRDGAAHRALADPDQAQLVARAAELGAVELERRIIPGRGGRRRTRDRQRDIVIEHLLGVYHDVTGRLPGITKDPLAEKRPSRRTIDFLTTTLAKFGLDVSPETLARHIDRYQIRYRRLELSH